jgi:hypothetical protein
MTLHVTIPGADDLALDHLVLDSNISGSLRSASGRPERAPPPVPDRSRAFDKQPAGCV